MSNYVIDANVLIVANGKPEDVSISCQLSCVKFLEEARANTTIFVDDAYEIMREYERNLDPKAQPGLGHAFYKWLHQNLSGRCQMTTINPLPGGSFAEFPTDSRLHAFDKSDHKYVAVVVASQVDPPIVNAVDTDWYHFKDILRECKINIEFICLDYIKDKVRT